MKATDLLDLDIICATSGGWLSHVDDSSRPHDLDFFYLHQSQAMGHVRIRDALPVVNALYQDLLRQANLPALRIKDPIYLERMWRKRRLDLYHELSLLDFSSSAAEFILHHSLALPDYLRASALAYCAKHTNYYPSAVEKEQRKLSVISKENDVTDALQQILHVDIAQVYPSVALFTKRSRRNLGCNALKKSKSLDDMLNPLTECDFVLEHPDSSISIVELKEKVGDRKSSSGSLKQLARAHFFFRYNFSTIPCLFGVSYRYGEDDTAYAVTHYQHENQTIKACQQYTEFFTHIN